jgi:nucleotide-binding universal stress UspA family protein
MPSNIDLGRLNEENHAALRVRHARSSAGFLFIHSSIGKWHIMKVLVPVKRVVDANVKVRVLSDQTGIDLNNVKMAINPFCEIAVEEAVRLKEKGVATEIVVVCMGPKEARSSCAPHWPWAPTAPSMVETNAELQPLAIAKLLKAVYDKEQPGWSSLANSRSTRTTARPARCSPH